MTDAGALPQNRDTEIPQVPELAQEPSITEVFAEAVGYLGVVGEEDTAILLYLAITSRLLARPVSVAIKGLSSSGKSWTADRTLEFFPPEAFIKFTSVSKKLIIHSKDSYKHRTLVFYEVHGLAENSEDEDSTAYYVRTLLSEGKLIYEYAKGNPQTGFSHERVEKEGPTNVIFTTTKTKVHPENETRCLSVTTDDSPEQTKAILRQLASGGNSDSASLYALEPWHELQRWLQFEAVRNVRIPYAETLAELIPPVAVRLRRDFSQILALIRAHAILHQVNRGRDGMGWVVANIEDYEVVRRVVGDLIAEGVEANVPPLVRETVEVVRELGGMIVGHEKPDDGVNAAQVARQLGIEKMGGHRRLRRAADGGWVRNLETRRFREGRWVVGEPLPDEVAVLPDPDTVREAMGVSRVSPGISGSNTEESHTAEGDSSDGIAVSRDSGGAPEEGEL